MVQKFCPRCKSNQSVTWKNGKRCCASCGFDADRMFPAITGDYDSSCPQYQSDVETPITISESTGLAIGENDDPFETSTSVKDTTKSIPDYVVSAKEANIDRIVTVILIAIYLVIVHLTMYTLNATWDSGEVLSGTIYQRYCSMDCGYIIIGLSIATILVALFCPLFMFVISIVTGLVCSIFSGWATGEYLWGLTSFIVAIGIGLFEASWENRFYPDGCDGKFFLAFWFNVRVKGYVDEVPEVDYK